ncbi:MAG: hypothetical protein JXR58_07255 [Bacteroidales bacterium]|nr:hypothetical protein [Bacteroidales bacterium]
MKTIISFVFFATLLSFTYTNGNINKTSGASFACSKLGNTLDKVIITYEKPDVCNLNYLGEIELTEKFLFYFNSGLKIKTIDELKRQASEKGGTIVYVYSYLQNGFGIGFTRTIFACVFKK